MTKNYFWHKKLWYRHIILTMQGQSFNEILTKTYIESLPGSLEESAEIDGAGSLKRYLLIVLPLSTPILATIAIFSAIGHWNSYTDTLFLMNDERLFTLQYLLYRHTHEALNVAKMLQMSPNAQTAELIKSLTPVAVRYTVSVVATLPILFVYPFFQRYFVKGIMISAVKG